MTHSGGKPHTNVGDNGQRYEVRAEGWPKADISIVGWVDTLEAAQEVLTSILLAPGCTSAEIYDREEDKQVIRRYGGILR